MEDFDLNLVARKSVKSIFALVSRTFLIQVLGIVASFILTVYLSPENFGVFFLVSSVVVFLNYFQDIGLAASLIQKKEIPTQDEYKTAFTVQQLMVLSVVIPALFLSFKVGEFFKIGQDGTILFIAFLVSFLLSSLRTIPTIMLERNLDFHRLVIPQIAENIFYNGALIIFAVKGFGLTSFTVAVLGRAIVGLIFTYYIMPWKPGIHFDKKIFRSLLSFGIPFQANSILALVKDDLINIFVGKILPLTQVGYIGFAQKWAFLPLRLIMDNVIKIIFPSFSRLQDDKVALKAILEKSMFLISFFIFPSAVFFIMFSTHFIELIPRYQKWEPAILSVAFFSLNAVFGSLSTPLANFLNAIGKVRITLYFMIFWTVIIWTSTPLFIKLWGYNGVSAASFLVALSSISIVFVVRHYVNFSFFGSVIKQFISAVLMAGFIYLIGDFINSLLTLFLIVILSGIFYTIVMFLLARKEIISSLRFIKGNIR